MKRSDGAGVALVGFLAVLLSPWLVAAAQWAIGAALGVRP